MNQRQMRQLGITEQPPKSIKAPVQPKKETLIADPSQNESTSSNSDSTVNSLNEATIDSASSNPTHLNDKHSNNSSANNISSNSSKLQLSEQHSANQKTTRDLEKDKSIEEIKASDTKESITHTTNNEIEDKSPAITVPSSSINSKLIQFRIEQACFYTQQDSEILLSDSHDADIIRELVLCSINFKDNNLTMLSLLLHCSTQHLKELYQTLKKSSEKKQSIHNFRKLQSDLLPLKFE